MLPLIWHHRAWQKQGHCKEFFHQTYSFTCAFRPPTDRSSPDVRTLHHEHCNLFSSFANPDRDRDQKSVNVPTRSSESRAGDGRRRNTQDAKLENSSHGTRDQQNYIIRSLCKWGLSRLLKVSLRVDSTDKSLRLVIVAGDSEVFRCWPACHIVAFLEISSNQLFVVSTTPRCGAVLSRSNRSYCQEWSWTLNVVEVERTTVHRALFAWLYFEEICAIKSSPLSKKRLQQFLYNYPIIDAHWTCKSLLPCEARRASSWFVKALAARPAVYYALDIFTTVLRGSRIYSGLSRNKRFIWFQGSAHRILKSAFAAM